MGFLHIIAFLSLSMIVSHAAVAPETYWKSVLPNTPMPKIITELLHNGDVINGPPSTSESATKYATTGKDFKYYANGYTAPNFLLEKDMYQGHELNLQFLATNNPSSTLLPREVAETIPFSSKNLPEIYTRFSIKPNSIASELMKSTMSQCEEKGTEGETEYCATSLESMVDFIASTLGKNVKAVSTDVSATKSTPKVQKYTIEGVNKVATGKLVACHNLKYPYTVFYCHKTASTRAYSVSLVGEDGTKVKGFAVCHKYAAKLYPKDMVFKVLKVKPGSTPLCHILPEDHLVWVSY